VGLRPMLFSSFNTICSIELRLKIIVRHQCQLKFFVQSEQIEMDNTEGDAENTDRSHDQPREGGERTRISHPDVNSRKDQDLVLMI